jgi:8-oxo-dGTP pyrophosphatase MutT (NUDIX family)
MIKRFTNRENECLNVDGREIWISRSVAVVTTVLILFENKIWVLLGQRGPASPNCIGKWNLPCGYLDWDENGTEAAKREVWEETGVYLDDFSNHIKFDHMDNPWKVKTVPIGDVQNISLHYGIVLDLNETDTYPEISSKNAVDGEVSALGWFPIDAIPKIISDDIAFNHLSRIEEFNKLYQEWKINQKT